MQDSYVDGWQALYYWWINQIPFDRSYRNYHKFRCSITILRISTMMPTLWNFPSLSFEKVRNGGNCSVGTRGDEMASVTTLMIYYIQFYDIYTHIYISLTRKIWTVHFYHRNLWCNSFVLRYTNSSYCYVFSANN